MYFMVYGVFIYCKMVLVNVYKLINSYWIFINSDRVWFGLNKIYCF